MDKARVPPRPSLAGDFDEAPSVRSHPPPGRLLQHPRRRRQLHDATTTSPTPRSCSTSPLEQRGAVRLRLHRRRLRRLQPSFSVDPANERPLNVYGFSKLVFDNYVRRLLSRPSNPPSSASATSTSTAPASSTRAAWPPSSITSPETAPRYRHHPHVCGLRRVRRRRAAPRLRLCQ